MDPVAHVDPLGRLVRPLAVPGQVLGQVAVRFGRIDAEPLEHVDAHLFLLRIDRVALEGGDQFVAADLLPAKADVDVPGLMVDARADEFQLALFLGAEHLGDLLAAVLHAVAKADRAYLAVFDRRPGIDCHRVGVVEEQRVGLGHFIDVAAEVEDHRNVALAVENSAGADRVADALVDTVFERDADVVGVGFQTANADATHDVTSALDRPAPVGRGRDPRRQAARRHRATKQFGDIGQARLVDIGEGDLNIAQFGHRHDVGEEPAGEADATGTNDRDLQIQSPLSRHLRAVSKRAARASELEKLRRENGDNDTLQRHMHFLGEFSSSDRFDTVYHPICKRAN